jgi:8-oxo-dGTP diphosphatase
VTREPPEVRAAGGVVVRERGGEREIAIVHRPKYDDWSLPKGKLDPGEEWREAALREVREETGLRCATLKELAPSSYVDGNGRSKLVRWWVMRPLEGEFRPSKEVDELRWAPPDRAADLLDYEGDRELVRAASGP